MTLIPDIQTPLVQQRNKKRAPLHRVRFRPARAYPQHASDARFANGHQLLCVCGLEKLAGFRRNAKKSVL